MLILYLFFRMQLIKGALFWNIRKYVYIDRGGDGVSGGKIIS